MMMKTLRPVWIALLGPVLLAAAMAVVIWFVQPERHESRDVMRNLLVGGIVGLVLFWPIAIAGFVRERYPLWMARHSSGINRWLSVLLGLVMVYVSVVLWQQSITWYDVLATIFVTNMKRAFRKTASKKKSGGGSKSYRVRVIVDPEYGGRLERLPREEPVWIVDSPGNHEAILKIWEKQKTTDHTSGITAFRWDLSGSAEDRLIAEMGSIDLHHGNYSHNPPHTELEAIGVGWSQRLAEALAEYGFTRHTNTEDGFVAFQ